MVDTSTATPDELIARLGLIIQSCWYLLDLWPTLLAESIVAMGQGVPKFWTQFLVLVEQRMDPIFFSAWLTFPEHVRLCV